MLFAVGLLGASLLAACVLPLTSAYAITEAFGWERGIDRSWSEAPLFNGIYTFVIFVGAALAGSVGIARSMMHESPEFERQRDAARQGAQERVEWQREARGAGEAGHRDTSEWRWKVRPRRHSRQ